MKEIDKERGRERLTCTLLFELDKLLYEMQEIDTFSHHKPLQQFSYINYLHSFPPTTTISTFFASSQEDMYTSYLQNFKEGIQIDKIGFNFLCFLCSSFQFQLQSQNLRKCTNTLVIQIQNLKMLATFVSLPISLPVDGLLEENLLLIGSKCKESHSVACWI